MNRKNQKRKPDSELERIDFPERKWVVSKKTKHLTLWFIIRVIAIVTTAIIMCKLSCGLSTKYPDKPNNLDTVIEEIIST